MPPPSHSHSKELNPRPYNDFPNLASSISRNSKLRKVFERGDLIPDSIDIWGATLVLEWILLMCRFGSFVVYQACL